MERRNCLWQRWSVPLGMEKALLIEILLNPWKMGHLTCPAAPSPRLKEYTTERRRSEAYAALGFTTDVHPMDLHTNQLRQFRVIPSTQLHRHVGKSVLAAGMLTTSKPVHTAKDEPMEFATFDDGAGLIETVLFPGVYGSAAMFRSTRPVHLPGKGGGGVRSGNCHHHTTGPAGTDGCQNRREETK